MRRPCTFLAVLLLPALAVASANLLTDPGFEGAAPVDFSGVEACRGGWRLFAVGGAEGEFRSTRDPHTGEWAMHFRRANTAGDTAVDRGMPDLLIPIEGGRVYRAGVWAKSGSGSSLRLTLATHDVDGGWTGKQVSKRFPLTGEYAFCELTMRVAAGVELANLAFRVDGIGEITVDDAVLVDVTPPPQPPQAPRVTWPVGPVDTLTPTVAWMGDAHDAYQLLVRTYGGNAVVFDSGEVESGAFAAGCGRLPADRRFVASVRLRNGVGWGPWSPGAEFGTPRVPLVSFESPREGDGVIGPDVAVRLRVEADDEVARLRILLDGEVVEAAEGSRESFALRDVHAGMHELRAELSTVSGGAAGAAEASARFHVSAPVRCRQHRVYVLDLRWLFDLDRADGAGAETVWDTCHAVATLQGIVNRAAPRLYVRYQGADDFWWDVMRGRSGWLRDLDAREVSSLEELVSVFADRLRGVVLYDEAPRAASNVASTIAGVEDLVAVRYSDRRASVYRRLVEGGPRLPVVVDLRGRFTGKGDIADVGTPSTGSAKCDAYLWALERYLKTGRADPTELAYYQDSYWLTKATRTGGSMEHTLLNHDFFVARRGFFCDLSVWADEAPLDDPGQPLGTDLATLSAILRACWEGSGGGVVHFGGFTPWAFKYTTSADVGYKHEPVETEWETAHVISAYNAFLDADACGLSDMANASFFTHFRLPEHMPQQRLPTRADMQKAGYLSPAGELAPRTFLLFYNGDYDSAAWVYRRVPGFWGDAARGEFPMNWALNPNLVERMPLAFYHCYATASPRDHFIAGDAGAGYLNVTQLFPPREPSDLPSGAAAWVRHCAAYYRRLNYSITGFLLNGRSGVLTPEAELLYAGFSGDGVMAQPLSMHAGSHMEGRLLVAEMLRDLTGDVGRCAEVAVSYAIAGQAQFLAFRTILRSPSFMRDLADGMERISPEAAFAPLGPYEFFYLQRAWLGQEPLDRATYTFDTVPRRMRAGRSYAAWVGVRNDGWDRWGAKGARLVLEWVPEVGRVTTQTFDLPCDVAPGEGVVIDVGAVAPAEPGVYTLKYQMHGPRGPFSRCGDLPFETSVEVTP